MAKAIEKLNEALSTMVMEQQGMTGENLLLSLKAVKSVIRAIETLNKIDVTAPEQTVNDDDKTCTEPIPVEAVEKVEQAVEQVVAEAEKTEEEKQEATEAVEEIKEEKPVKKWILTKTVKIDTFNKMCEKAWADSGLKDKSIKKAVYDKLTDWYKLEKTSPWAGFSKHDMLRPHSQEELEKDMYENFDFQFSAYDGYKENN